MPRKSDAKEKLIKTGAELFWRRGYHAVGLTEILEKSGAPKGSFYHHFPEGKDQLAEQCLYYSGKRLEKSVDEAFENSGSLAEAIDKFAERMANWFEDSEYKAGCPVTTVILETTPQSPRIQKAAQSIFDNWNVKIANHIMQLEGVDRETALNKAHSMVLSFEGAWIIARVQKSRQPFMLAAQLCR